MPPELDVGDGPQGQSNMIANLQAMVSLVGGVGGKEDEIVDQLIAY